MDGIRLHGCTQGELIERLAELRPSRRAVVFPEMDVAWSFADLEARSLEWARGLIALGVEPGEHVAVWAPNHPDWVALQFAIARIGAVLVTANTQLTRPEIEYVLRQSRSVVVLAAGGLVADEFRQALEPLVDDRKGLPDLRHVVLLDGMPPSGAWSTDVVLARGRQIDEAEVDRRTRATPVDAPANIQYTSGTTGFPKGVVLSHANVVENADAMAQVLGLHDEDALLLQVPLFHCFGCVITVLGAATRGLPLVGVRRFEPGAVLRVIESERCTIANGVPTMFQALLAHPDRAERDLSSLRGGIMAGTSCPEALMHRVIDELGAAEMLVAYGLTEASPAVTTSLPDDPVPVRCGTVGRELPGVEVRVVDPETGAEVGLEQEGELVCRGPNVMLGYFGMPEETARVLDHDRWLHTGDLATKDADGLYRIVGRIKEMILRGGENVYPAEVEDVVRGHPSVRDVAVFPVPSEAYGEEVGAVLVLETGASLSTADLSVFLEDRLAAFKRPSHLGTLDELPLTASGKVRRALLPEWHAAGELELHPLRP